ncbi:MAG: hypothetical protein WDN06_12385 [Asticcacaulis sp.]
MKPCGFPLLFVAAVSVWLFVSLASAMRRRNTVSHGGSVTLRLPEDTHIVRDDAVNRDNPDH